MGVSQSTQGDGRPPYGGQNGGGQGSVILQGGGPNTAPTRPGTAGYQSQYTIQISPVAVPPIGRVPPAGTYTYYGPSNQMMLTPTGPAPQGTTPNFVPGPGQAALPGQHQPLEATEIIKTKAAMRRLSLAIQPRPTQPSLLEIHCKIDANGPFALTSFVGASEMTSNDPPSQMILCRGRRAPARSYFEPGSQTVPRPGGQDAAHVIDLELIPRAELTDPLALKVDDGLGATQFPLILRIEWLTDAGRAEGKRLEDLTPGDPLPAYVGAYTLFFQLTARDNGTYDGKLLKTILWHAGTNYETQEMYGIAGLTSTEDGDTGKECVICMTKERDTAMLPCRHLCMCNECSQIMISNQTSIAKKCPICRRQVHNSLRINFANLQPELAATAAAAAAAGPGAGGAPKTPLSPVPYVPAPSPFRSGSMGASRPAPPPPMGFGPMGGHPAAVNVHVGASR